MQRQDFSLKMFMVLVFILVMMSIIALASVASAQSYYHELIITLDGEYDLNKRVVLPEANLNIELEGVGKAYIKSTLIIVAEDMDKLKDWWNLF